MIIENSIYEEIIYKCSSISIETGGVIGGNNGVINKFLFDKGIETTTPGCYVPDVDLLNFMVYKWYKRNIEFYGIVHNHVNEYQDLSFNDKNFIYEIMTVMPENIKILYFPIVYSKSIHSYKATRSHNEIYINDDNVIMI